MPQYRYDTQHSHNAFTVAVSLLIAVIFVLVIIGAAVRHIPSTSEPRRQCESTGGRLVHVAPGQWTCFYTVGR